MSDYKAGLHKDVSEIFNGVSLPKNNVQQKPSVQPGQGSQNNNTPKPPAPSHMTPTRPKLEQSPAKSAEAKQSEAGAVIKTVEQAAWQRTLGQIKSKLFAQKPGVNAGRQKTMVVLAPILFIVLIFMFIRAFSTPSRKITGAGISAELNAPASEAKAKVDWQVPQPYPTTLRDPMQFGPATPMTTSQAETGTAGLIIKGIVYSKENPCAVIGDRMVHQGDKVLDVVIVKINEDSVEFEANGRKWEQKVQR
ncbi:MAG: hypothetical protein PHY02_09480 [Phycisphaerae bacterium]|nr:hypothetical protein [Phycisphaerae bacterium]